MWNRNRYEHCGIKFITLRGVDTDDAFFARNHNDSNVLCISSNNDINNIYEIVDTFLNTKTSEEERHHKRVQKIINYENGEYNEL